MTNKEIKSCVGTIEMLRRLAYNIHGVMDVIDADNCEKIIKALEQEQKWTPVAEGLPKKDGLYLVSVKNDHLRKYSKTCWYSDKNWFARQDVVAWMPLPEPYNGGE